MHAIAPKINQKKGSPSQPRSNDDEKEASLATKGEENIDGPFKLHQQKLHILMAGESIMKICKQQLDDSGHSRHKISKFFLILLKFQILNMIELHLNPHLQKTIYPR